ncbi:GntR family transcriptional regulator [Microbacterium wangchenii]|uniref:GntR family transcriptional regulator n=2 Tax=Microbacteriaceae TaxID=85023 RepID=A0ABX5SU98_9MICO|nr:GntR family transcriptional regulator [Microbacterium wangchenii]TXK20146.1 GntR family transcriptional regulator [Microbacterium wangchenii]
MSCCACNTRRMAEVYEALKDLVLSGAIHPGVRVSEAELSERLHVSRTPVREALARLEGDGLVHARGRGVRVASLDVAALVLVLEAREALESWAVGRAAERVAAGLVPPARLARLRTLAAEADERTRAGELASAVSANREFHLAATALCENALVQRTLEGYWNLIAIATRAGLDEARRADSVDREHRGMLDALTGGDAAAAARLAADHVRRTREVLSKEDS